MRKKMILILLCLLSLNMLAGCKADALSNTGPKKTTQEEKKDEKEKPQKEKKKKKKKNSKKDKDDWESVDESSEEVDYEGIYAPVLDEVRDVIGNGYDYDKDYSYVSTGIMERAMYPGDDDLARVIGYYLEDLNDDGIQELLIGENSGYEYGNLKEASFIYSGFTCKDGKPVCFVEGWARNRHHYIGDGHFFNTGSSGAMNTDIGEWHLEPEAVSPTWDDYYFTMEDVGNGGIAVFYNNTGSDDTALSERLSMTEDEFNDRISDYEKKVKTIDWTPFIRGEAGGEATGDEDQTAIVRGMIIPDSDTRKLTEDDLAGLDAKQLRIARNEIYARHGRRFKDKELQDHFNNMEWYFPIEEGGSFDDGCLSAVEKYNADLISRYEKEHSK